ncbi:MAG: ammonium transporter [Trueperaceae bacterium]|nr:ammonium transporter [Trueperaceae bacterium]
MHICRLVFLSAAFLASSLAYAQEEGVADVAFALDTFALLVCALLVILMQPGFALLEAGLHESKNVVNIFMKNIADFAVAGLAYWAVGFTIMYGGGLFLAEYVTGMNVPSQADFFFQMVFAATAATIVSGAVGGRMRFPAYLIFSVVMTGFIYPFMGAWQWGGGWLSELGFADFAGSSVVHAVGGFAALGAVLAIGPRLGRYLHGRPQAIPGHNLAYAGLGMFLLWIGWFGFNGGSQLAFSTQADAEAIANVFLNTNLAAAAGGVAAMAVSWAAFGKPDVSMTINGVLGGLVSITAGPDVVVGLAAVAAGAIGGVIVVASVIGLDRLQVDDPVGAISVHGVAGIWGTVAVGVFGGASIPIQLLGAFSYALGALVAGYVVFMILKATLGLRVSPAEEVRGLDIAEHGGPAYQAHDTLHDPVVASTGN